MKRDDLFTELRGYGLSGSLEDMLVEDLNTSDITNYIYENIDSSAGGLDNHIQKSENTLQIIGLPDESILSYTRNIDGVLTNTIGESVIVQDRTGNGADLSIKTYTGTWNASTFARFEDVVLTDFALELEFTVTSLDAIRELVASSGNVDALYILTNGDMQFRINSTATTLTGVSVSVGVAYVFRVQRVGAALSYELTKKVDDTVQNGAVTVSDSSVMFDQLAGTSGSGVLPFLGQMPSVKFYNGAGALINHFVVEGGSEKTGTVIYDVVGGKHATILNPPTNFYTTLCTYASYLANHGGSDQESAIIPASYALANKDAAGNDKTFSGLFDAPVNVFVGTIKPTTGIIDAGLDDDLTDVDIARLTANYKGFQQVFGGAGGLAVYSADQIPLTSIKITKYLETDYLNDIYRLALSKAPGFKAKLIAGTDDLEILLLGDSFFAACNTASAISDAEPANVPPSCQYNHTIYNLWKSIVTNKQQYDRYDSTVNTFTESGVWSSASDRWDSPSWCGEFAVARSLTRQSVSENASIQFSWDLSSYEKLNIIYRASVDGVSSATISVAEGDGVVEVYNGTLWVEANAYSFSQYIDPAVATDGSGVSQWLANLKLKMRRVVSTGNATITMSKGANSDYLYYWGTERWSGVSVFITNVARGGQKSEKLQKTVVNDVVGRNPDLVIFSLPLVNELSSYAGPAFGYQTILDRTQDFVWGDRVGNLNNLSLKSLSNDWTDFEVVLVIPGYRTTYWDGNTDITYTFDGQNDATHTPYQVYGLVQEFVASQGDISLIDMGRVMLQQAKSKGWSFESAFVATSAESTGSFTSDGTHPNDLQASIWGDHLSEMFDR